MTLTKFSKKSYSKPTLLIDGDLFLYKAAAAAETEVDWGDDIWSLSSDLKDAKAAFTRSIERFKQTLMASKVVLTISGSNNFRMDVEPTYKGGRKKTRKPVGYKALVDWAMETYESLRVDCLEADDIMGVLGSIPGTKAIIVSDDKDMMGIPGALYRPMREQLMHTTQEDADRYFFSQTLSGDPTDGYNGLGGVGPKTAEKILGSHPTWNTVVAAYQKQNLTADHALTQARLARILRHTDWDDEAGAVKLWEPTR